MFKRILTVVAAAALTVATYATAVEMSEARPDTYVVRKGDTLWDISARFLKKPWLWPEIWQANPQIKNPHLIYPGDVLSLAYLDRVNPKVTVQPGPRQAAPVNGLPLSAVEPFLKNLRVIDSFSELPYIVGMDGNRLRTTGGQVAYVTGLDSAQPGQRYAVYRPTVRFSQPRGTDDLSVQGTVTAGSNTLWNYNAVPNSRREQLGYELAKVNTGTVTGGGNGRAVTLALQDSGFEVRAGDRLLPVEAQPYDLHFFPHAPKVAVEPGKLRILAVANALTSGGPHDVVAISGGSREGIDNGTVFSIWRQGSHVLDRVNHDNTSRMDDATRSSRGRVALPDEYAAHVMVFRTFDRVSYGLIMEGTRPARVGYELKHPDAQ